MTQPQVPQPPKEKRSPERLIAWFAVIAAIYVSLRILVVARGNSDTLRALVQNLNIPAIFMATILPLITTALAVLSFLFLMSALGYSRGKMVPKNQQSPQQVARAQLSGAIIVWLFVLVVGWWSMPLKYVVISIGTGSVLLVIYLVSIFSTKFKALFGLLAGISLLSLLVGGLVIAVAQVGVWLPRERLTVNGHQTGIAYVLSSDGQWTKYLDDATHKVEIIRTADIQRRAPVQDESSGWDQPPSEYFAR